MANEEKLTGSNLKGLLDAAVEIGRKRHDILQRMRAAFERGDNLEALQLGRELCGLKDEKASSRIDTGIN